MGFMTNIHSSEYVLVSSISYERCSARSSSLSGTVLVRTRSDSEAVASEAFVLMSPLPITHSFQPKSLRMHLCLVKTWQKAAISYEIRSAPGRRDQQVRRKSRQLFSQAISQSRDISGDRVEVGLAVCGAYVRVRFDRPEAAFELLPDLRADLVVITASSH